MPSLFTGIWAFSGIYHSPCADQVITVEYSMYFCHLGWEKNPRANHVLNVDSSSQQLMPWKCQPTGWIWNKLHTWWIRIVCLPVTLRVTDFTTRLVSHSRQLFLLFRLTDGSRGRHDGALPPPTDWSLVYIKSELYKETKKKQKYFYPFETNMAQMLIRCGNNAKQRYKIRFAKTSACRPPYNPYSRDISQRAREKMLLMAC